MKIVINKCYGGFGLSDKAFERLIELGMSVGDEEDLDADIVKRKNPSYITGNHFFSRIRIYEPEFRANPLLVQVVEELGDEASGKFAELKIVEIPDDTSFTIEEYDGIEWIAESHRTWR